MNTKFNIKIAIMYNKEETNESLIDYTKINRVKGAVKILYFMCACI
jgi:hypothetical protein